MSSTKLALYVCGKWDDRKEIRLKMDRLEKDHGFKITHDWTCTALDSPDRDDAVADIDGVTKADLVIAFLLDAKYAYRGSWTELGAAMALGKKIFIVAPLNSESRRSIFYSHPLVTSFLNEEELFAKLQKKEQ